MRAVIYDDFGAQPAVTDVPDPSPGPGEAVIRVSATGLCRSDWHGWRGHDPDITVLPHIPGHEYAGTVAAVGQGVAPTWVGIDVTAPFVLGCGACPVCARGDAQVCPHQAQPGFSHPGSWAEYVAVPAAAANLVVLPEDLSPGIAAGLGCRIATAYRAVVARGRPEPGDWVVILGCGGVGLSAVMIAASLGARVVAVDVAQRSLDRASELGAEHGLIAGPDTVAQVHEITGGGARVSLDCVGSPDTCRDGVLSLARGGRHVQVGLLPPAAGLSAVPMERVIGWELALVGSHGMPARDYPALLEAAGDRIDVRRLLDPGPALTLAQAADALTKMATRPSEGIILIDPGEASSGAAKMES